MVWNDKNTTAISWVNLCILNEIAHINSNFLNMKTRKTTCLLLCTRSWQDFFVTCQCCISFLSLIICMLHEAHTNSNSYCICRDHSKHDLGKWEKALLCNAFSYWPSPYPEWSLTCKTGMLVYKVMVRLFVTCQCPTFSSFSPWWPCMFHGISMLWSKQMLTADNIFR